MKHRHHFRHAWYSGKEIGFRCRCGEEKRRPTTDKEKREIAESWGKREKRSGAMHRISWDFSKRFKTADRQGWKKEGYELMAAVEKWAAKHPTVIVTGCDDYCYAGARLVLIPHERRGEYWGTTVYFLQQFGPPAEFFLYPGHLDGMLSALKKLKKKFRKPEEKELRFSWKPK